MLRGQSLILEEGLFFPQDDQGHLVNPTSWDLVNEPWRSAVEAARDLAFEAFGSRLHSVYLRGSTALGNARIGISDLDFLFLVSSVEADDGDVCRNLGALLTEEFPFVAGLDAALIPLAHVEFSSVQFLLKVKSLFLGGTDLRTDLPMFEPGHRAALQYARLVGWDVGRCQTLLCRAPSRIEEGIGSWMGKRLVRSGFELVMREARTYTTDLYPSYRVFAEHYPEREPDMRRALELAVGSLAEPSEVRSLASNLGVWLATKVDHVWRVSKPTPIWAPIGGMPSEGSLEPFERETLFEVDQDLRFRIVADQRGATSVALYRGREEELRLPGAYLEPVMRLCATTDKLDIDSARAWERTSRSLNLASLLKELLDRRLIRSCS